MRRLAEMLGVARGTLERLLKGRSTRNDERVLNIIGQRFTLVWREQRGVEADIEQAQRLLEEEIARDGLVATARRIGCDPANLAAMMKGRRSFPRAIVLVVLRQGGGDRHAT